MTAGDSKPKRPRGQPTAYRDEFADQAGRLAKLGLTDAEQAEFFQVSERCFHGWKKTHADFLQALTDGKTVADARVADSLYRSAVGEHLVAEVREVTQDADGTTTTKTVSKAAPSVAAGIFWLKNRRPKDWRDKVEVEADVNLCVFPPKEQLDALHNAALARAAERSKMLAGRRERLGCIDTAEGDMD
ncbi:hypothetical protein [uncultured Thiodictyon sp.]|uniref:hypothetical protein n=1 Tax=uncultured Thiodictyon sp. TaxID=1846217 RepID=UPI0025ECA0FE|nr:hypothetical protein [uncultured Thiodictyon sp.]